jgi:response regulator RpfG family c-di-GMP phosphodiesterase
MFRAHRGDPIILASCHRGALMLHGSGQLRWGCEDSIRRVDIGFRIVIIRGGQTLRRWRLEMNDDERGKIRLLLIESDEMITNIFIRNALMRYSSISLDVATNSVFAEDMWSGEPYDIVVCDALLAKNARLNFIRKMCFENDAPLLLVITADTDMTKDKLEANTCCVEILYKPISLQDFVAKVSIAINKVSASKAAKRNRIT